MSRQRSTGSCERFYETKGAECPVGSRSTNLIWLPDRWLAATTEDGLLLDDAVDDTVAVPPLPVQRATKLVVQPTL